MKAKKSAFDVLRQVKENVRNGTYVLSRHAIARQKERDITLRDVLAVLEHGRHEQNKDEFSVKNQTWKYAIRGKTVNGLELRVVVLFEEEMVIVTVIDVD